jgi:hypothetical protein
MEILVSKTVPYPVSAVFAVIADLAHWPEWEESFLEVAVPAATVIREGLELRCRRKVPRIVDSRLRVTSYQPDRQIMIEGDWVGSFKPAGGFSVRPVPGGGTEIVSVGRPELKGLMRLGTPVLRLVGKRLSVRYLDKLAAVVGRRSA